MMLDRLLQLLQLMRCQRFHGVTTNLLYLTKLLAARDASPRWLRPQPVPSRHQPSVFDCTSLHPNEPHTRATTELPRASTSSRVQLDASAGIGAEMSDFHAPPSTQPSRTAPSVAQA